MKRFITAFIAMMILTAVAAAQTPAVRWRTTVKMTSPTEGVVTVRALVGQGWHLYGFDLPDGGPKPTVFDFSKSKGVEFTGVGTPSTKPVSAVDPLFKKTLQWWDANVSFSRTFKVTDRAGAHIGLSIKYMACDGNQCMPPKTENISVAVPEFKK